MMSSSIAPARALPINSVMQSLIVEGIPLSTDPPRLSPDRARTARQYRDVENGLNPLTRTPKHPDAPDDCSPTDRYPREGTCGTCKFRTSIEEGTKRLTRASGEIVEVPKVALKCGFRKGERISYGPATDIRSWWPGCGDYKP